MLIYVQNIGSGIEGHARNDRGARLLAGRDLRWHNRMTRKGYTVMQLVSYLNFNGNCREAFDFYQKALGGETVAMIPYADMGIPDMDEAMKSLIVHARLVIGNQTLMGSDVTDQVQSLPAPVQVSVQVDSVEEAERIFAALAEGGNVMMPIEEQSWAARFGFLQDRFGIPWMVNCERAS